jgi:phage terminase large subunit-like protein
MEDKVTQYAMDVTSGKEVAGKYVRLACQRHLDDLEKSKVQDYDYTFSVEAANNTIDFFENLRFTDGEMAGKPVKLMPFQDFIVGSIFGWLIKTTGKRRFRKSYVQLGRKNAKSLLNSGIAIKLCGFDNYPNAQVYTTATKMQQARIVWKQAAKFIKKEPDLRELFKIKDHDALIENKINGGTITALGRDTGTIDGFDPHGGIIDEYHRHKTNQMVKLLEDGSVDQTESLISIITTAGFDLNSPCYKEYEYCVNVLEGVVNNDQYFIYIAQMDKDDDIWDESNWIKANPLVYQLPQGRENLKRFAKESKEKGGEDLRNFITKSLNKWYKFSENQYLDIDNWKACAGDLTLEDFRGQECGLGLDLSSGGDLTSGVLEFQFTNDEGEPEYFFHHHSFMPKNRLAEHIKTDKAPYDVWTKQGLITLTETLGGVKTDYKYIIEYYKKLIAKHNLKLTVIAYDPHNADAFLSDLDGFGVDCVEITQSAKSLNTPTVDFKLSVDGKQVHYSKKDELFRFCGFNAVTTQNSFGEEKIDKERRAERIDPIDATIDIHKIMMVQADAFDINESANEYLEMMEQWREVRY